MIHASPPRLSKSRFKKQAHSVYQQSNSFQVVSGTVAHGPGERVTHEEETATVRPVEDRHDAGRRALQHRPLHASSLNGSTSPALHLLHELLQMFTNTLLSAYADAASGAGYGAVTESRADRRNGHRHLGLETEPSPSTLPHQASGRPLLP